MKNKEKGVDIVFDNGNKTIEGVYNPFLEKEDLKRLNEDWNSKFGKNVKGWNLKRKHKAVSKGDFQYNPWAVCTYGQILDMYIYKLKVEVMHSMFYPLKPDPLEDKDMDDLKKICDSSNNTERDNINQFIDIMEDADSIRISDQVDIKERESVDDMVCPYCGFCSIEWIESTHQGDIGELGANANLDNINGDRLESDDAENGAFYCYCINADCNAFISASWRKKGVNESDYLSWGNQDIYSKLVTAYSTNKDSVKSLVNELTEKNQIMEIRQEDVDTELTIAELPEDAPGASAKPVSPGSANIGSLSMAQATPY
tara:strand:+ start:11 stop:952 length:942 start_codon:yes stop_codon:yes gene_type:complete